MGLRNAARLLLALALPVLLAFAWPLASSSAAEGESNCGAAANPIVCENALPGDPAKNWQVEGVGDPSIQGFATSMSVNVGETESFKIKTEASAYHIEILRLGYYGGNGARVVAANVTPSAELPQIQPECLHEVSTGLIDCGNWGVSAQWTVPSNAVSGVYIAELTRNDTGGKSQIPFVVRNDASHSKILLQTSDATWEAYNDYGGNSLYTCTIDCPAGSPKAYKGAAAVSYNRPFDGAFVTDDGASYLWYAEYQMMRFLEKNGYNVSYTTQDEVDRNGALLKNHKVFISSGHDEYWSAGQRANVEAAREAGVNLAFFSANEVFWKTRWGPSTEGSETPYRTLTSYKETHFEGPVDPKDPPTWTGAWRDPRVPNADGGKPENALTGQQFEVNSGTAEITVPAQYSKLRVWRNTAVANLAPGQTLTLAPGTGTLGYEWDEDVDNGFRPAGEFDLSSTTVTELQSFIDYGSTLNYNATGTHHLTLYRAPSGALVFGAGTVQWAWGLENADAWEEPNTDPGRHTPDPNMEQFTVNLLAEMGAQPETLIAGLVTPTPSTNTTPPSSTITSPTAGETFQDGSKATIAGTATAAAGAVIAGVEVSTDNGNTWHPATITTSDEQAVNWSYTWPVSGYPSTTIKSRAVDDSANLETPSAGIKVNVNCPCSIWGTAITPPTPESSDNHSVEVGTKFTTETFGVITGMRFYKSAANAGTHTGSLWSSTGQRLATATFTNETETGWQQVNFSTPVDVFPNTTYIVSYFAPDGHYADSPFYFYTPPPTGGNILNSPPLHAVSAAALPTNGAYVSANGVYAYGTTSSYPSNSFQGTNYWVDPIYEPASAPGQPTNITATPGNLNATITWTPPTTGGPTTTYTITPYIGTEPQTPTTTTGTPPAATATISGLTGGTSYTFTVQASNPNGSGPISAHSSAVTPSALAAPSAPNSVTASAASSQALVSWTAPSSNGGSAITGYTVTPYVGSTAQTPIEVAPTATSLTIKGLSNGGAYTFTVTAKNVIGTGPASSASNVVTPQDTIFEFATPATVDSGDANATNAGVKFSSEVAGKVTGIRFYKATTNTGTHVGSLWSATGTLLAQATFTTETASGWQEVSFATPVFISANTTYVASYLAPKGHYSDTSAGFNTSATSNPPLTALANATSVNGVYTYSTKSAFPTSSYKATNYWVDVAFEPSLSPGQVTNVSTKSGNGAASVSWSAPGGDISTYTITPYIGATAQTATTITGTPPATTASVTGLTNGTSYTFTVTASNPNGAGPASSPSAAVTPATTPSAPTSVSATAGNASAALTWNAPASNGGSAITGYTITPYIGNTAQTATTITGTPPATGTTITGLTNGTTYTFTVTATNAVGNSPASEHSAATTPFTTPSAPTAVTATGATSQAQVSWSAPSNTGGSAITGYTITPYIGATAQTSSEAAPSATSAIIAGLTNGTGYTFTVKANNAAGSGPQSSASATTTPRNTIFDYATPTTVDSADTNPTNVGVKFSSETYGAITGIRFYKTTTNTGTHVGSLWSASGTLLASATFTSETASGWQQVNFATPVLISPNTTYVASYLAPKGHYSDTASQLAFSGVSNPPLSALMSTTGSANGVYVYNSANAFPTVASKATNYWVDVAFEPAATPGQVTNVNATAGNGSASVSWSAPSGGPATSYTITPYIGTEAQKSTTITGTPPATGTTITGLSNGTSYTFTVQASNPNGAGPASSPSAAVTPITTPSAPTGVSATRGNGCATVTWNAPATGGSPITSYTITPYIGSEAQTPTMVTGAPPSVNITGLSNGTSYTFTVAATNAAGAGPASEHSGPVTPATTPSAPSSVTAAAGNASANVTWTAPSNNGGSPITGYTITPYIGTEAQTPTTVNGSPPATGTTITSLTVGTTYTFTVTATNAVGNGPASEQSNAITSTAAPSAPSGVTAAAGNASANVTWSAPSSNGGSPITSYTITPYIGATAQTATTITGTPPATGTTITGLTNGTTYTFTVTATNTNGNGPASEHSAAATPSTTPSTPTGVAAAAGNASATVTWTAPSSNGGSAITSYTVTPYIGSEAQTATTITGTPPATGTTITGLTNGTTYTFTVTATNAIGSGPASEPSSAVTPATVTVPAAPAGVTASAGNASATVGWSAPENGGSAITSYTVTPYIGSEAQTATTITGTPPATGTTITGLTNGTTYTFTVTATNAIGSGLASGHSASVTPSTTPSAPAGVSASPGNASATVSWNAPANGGSAITGYTITPYIGTTAQTASEVGASTTSTTIKGLTNGTSYTFTVTAANANGAGPASSKSSAVTPATTPSAPTGVTATAGGSSAALTWTAPSSNGGSPITSYTITPYVGATAQTATTITGTPPATGTTITGLTAGTSYTFTVTATNSAGTGPASEHSSAVTPFTTPSAPTAITASAATSQAQIAWSAPSSTGGSPITGYTITPYIGATAQTPSEAAASATSAIVKGLTNGSSYTFTVKANNAAGSGPASEHSGAAVPQNTIFDFATPATIDSGDTHATVAGIKFTSTIAGFVTGIRFYKATTNTGTHVGSLWSESGTLLGSATFTSETASGWQQVNFATPIAINANTTYVAAYLAPKGHYSDTSAEFTSAGFTNSPLSALSNTISVNGVYAYSSTSVFPTSTYKATNYWVDLDFEP